MSDLISREDAIHILACEMYAEAQSEGYDAESVEDYIPEATAWMSDAPSAVCDDCIWHVCNYNKVDWDGEDGYISKRDALAEFRDGRDVYDIMESIESLPSADRPTGRWVRKEKEINDCDGHRAYYWYECDNCGARPPKDQLGHEWHSDFCPSCGARCSERMVRKNDKGRSNKITLR